MEKKTNLNNQQRKMLDEVYMEQFGKIERNILSEREKGKQILSLQLIKDESEKQPVKGMLKAIRESIDAFKKASPYMEEMGLDLSNDPKETVLTIERYRGPEHPKLKKYNEETRRIEEDLAKKRKEIRARIYGMDTTYAEVEAEIAKYIKNI